MRICVICEGCYPYTPGGVSSWLHHLMADTPQHEYVVWAISAQKDQYGAHAYTLPSNVVRVQDVYLDAAQHARPSRRNLRIRLTTPQREALHQLFACRDPDWEILFSLFRSLGNSSLALLSHRAFWEILLQNCSERHTHTSLSDYFWNIRSMFAALLYLLGGEAPEADLYHAVSAGYAGVLGAWAATERRKPFVVTEHGIYTREREEEIIRSDWVPPQFKDLWIAMFYMFTRCAYHFADRVTCLFSHAGLLQQEIGCPAGKNEIVSNGIKLQRFLNIPPKEPDGWMDVGAFIRVVPIKDIKTMLYAFAQVNAANDRVRLHILGPAGEDDAYLAECLQLAEDLDLGNALFAGQVDTAAYMKKLDFTLLTSISEGQPLSILESMAAGRPVVSTDVGSCRELIEGNNDGYGPAGFCVPVMHLNALAEAILTLAGDSGLRARMGQSAVARAQALYNHQVMLDRYQQIYKDAREAAAAKWPAQRNAV